LVVVIMPYSVKTGWDDNSSHHHAYSTHTPHHHFSQDMRPDSAHIFSSL
jgi:hypothetical protein